jgi:hypothetical protein
MAAAFQNGSFEVSTPAQTVDGQYNSTAFAGWTPYTNGTYVSIMMRYTPPSTVVVPDGAQYGQIQVTTTANKYAGFYQIFDTIPGYAYTVQGSYRPLSGSATARIGVDLSGGTARPSVWGATLSGATSTLWNTFQFTTAPATGTSMTIFLDGYVTAAGKSIAFDNIQVPEPGSIVALLSGLVGLVGFGVRRRK